MNNFKRRRTIVDYAGTLPNLGMSIEEMREKAIVEVAKERRKGLSYDKKPRKRRAMTRAISEMKGYLKGMDTSHVREDKDRL